MVLSKVIWILAYVPLMPYNLVRIMLSLWILVPTWKGERVAYAVLSDKLDEFESRMIIARNYLVEKVLTTVMYCAVHVVTQLKDKTDLESLLKVKTLSDKVEAELASELMVRNRFKKNVVKTYDKLQSDKIQPERDSRRDPTEETEETQYFEADSNGSVHDEEPPFVLNKDLSKNNNRVSQQFPKNPKTMESDYNSTAPVKLSKARNSDIKSSAISSKKPIAAKIDKTHFET
jgi:hypothetical protein